MGGTARFVADVLMPRFPAESTDVSHRHPGPPVIIFDPALGYGKFMRIKDSNDGSCRTDGRLGRRVSSVRRPQLHQAITGQPRPQAQIYFVMSTWNPYNVMLMHPRGSASARRIANCGSYHTLGTI